jgi:hypothetical protein
MEAISAAEMRGGDGVDRERQREGDADDGARQRPGHEVGDHHLGAHDGAVGALESVAGDDRRQDRLRGVVEHHLAHPEHEGGEVERRQDMTSRRRRRSSPPATSARIVLAETISRRRSSRSPSTPACRLNSSHGSRVASATPAIAIGSRVSSEANQGKARETSPSPRFELATAPHSRQ